jgi:hypothetical protein
MRKLVIVAALAVAALVAAGTAGATPPTTTTVSLHRSFPHYLACPGFWIDGEFNIQKTTTTYYDIQGNPLRTIAHVLTQGTLADPLTGTSVPDWGDFTVATDLATNTTTTVGITNIATSPDGTVLYQVLGLLVVRSGAVVFEVGPHDDIDGTYGALCSYLASP